MQSFRSIGVEARDGVGIGVEHEGHTVMSRALGRHFWMHIGCEQGGGVYVAKIVQEEGGRQLGATGHGSQRDTLR